MCMCMHPISVCVCVSYISVCVCASYNCVCVCLCPYVSVGVHICMCVCNTYVCLCMLVTKHFSQKEVIHFTLSSALSYSSETEIILDPYASSPVLEATELQSLVFFVVLLCCACCC